MTTTTTYKFLDFVSFSGLYNWSVQYLNESKIQFNEKYPLVRIGDFLLAIKLPLLYKTIRNISVLRLKFVMEEYFARYSNRR